MFAEGFAIEDCTITKTLRVTNAKGEERSYVLTSDVLPGGIGKGVRLSVALEAQRSIDRPELVVNSKAMAWVVGAFASGAR